MSNISSSSIISIYYCSSSSWSIWNVTQIILLLLIQILYDIRC
jgi:hypothetical protein